MKNKIFSLIVFVILSQLLMVASVSSVLAGWHDWSQYSRNQAILDRAYEDDGYYVGVSCKEWARDVVYDASSGAVIIPSTVDPPGWYWYYHQYVVGRSSAIECAEP